MAKDDLTGNMPTEEMIAYFDSKSIEHGVDEMEFGKSMSLALSVFP